MKKLNLVLLVVLMINVGIATFNLMLKNDRTTKWNETFYETGLWLYPEHPAVAEVVMSRKINGVVDEINSNNSFKLKVQDNAISNDSNLIDMTIDLTSTRIFKVPSTEAINKIFFEISNSTSNGYVSPNLRDIIKTQYRREVKLNNVDQLLGQYIEIVEKTNLKTLDSFISEINILSR